LETFPQAALPLDASKQERATWSVGKLIAWHLLRGTRPDGTRNPWTREEFVAELGGSNGNDRNFRNWKAGKTPTVSSFRTLNRILFGAHPANEELRAEFLQRWSDAHNRRWAERRARKSGRPVDQPTPVPPRPELPLLFYAQLDDLPIDTKWMFHPVQYAEGAQIRSVSADRLFWLPEETRLLDEHGYRRDPAILFGKNRESRCDSEIFFPHEIYVSGVKRDRNWAVLVHICTDIPYPSDPAEEAGNVFRARCLIELGGIAPFVDRHGTIRPRRDLGLGGEHGDATVIAAVAYHGGVPQCRSRYFLIVRKGVRYPEDVWLSTRTGRPICPREGDISGQRFVFQSREAKGGSTDIFVADYNGGRMCNITAHDVVAWDGFVNESGNEVVQWTEDGQVQFYSTVNGKGFGEVITRPDCVPLSDTKAA